MRHSSVANIKPYRYYDSDHYPDEECDFNEPAVSSADCLCCPRDSDEDRHEQEQQPQTALEEEVAGYV